MSDEEAKREFEEMDGEDEGEGTMKSVDGTKDERTVTAQLRKVYGRRQR